MPAEPIRDRGPGWTRLPDWLERRPLRVLAGAFLAGLFAAFGQAPIGLWPATLAGLGLAFALLGAAPSLRRATFTGWAFGLGYFGLTLIWIVQPFLVDVARHGWMAPFAWFFMAGGMALFWGAGFGLARWLAPAGRLGWLAFAASLGAAELVRARLWTGFPWGGPGLVWIDTPVAQLARLAGAYGLSGAVPPVLFAAGLALVFGAGLVAGRGEVPARTEPLRLRLVQPNAPQHLKWEPDWIGVFWDRGLALTEAPWTGPGPGPDLVVWSETSLPAALGEAPGVEDRLAVAADPARVVVGAVRREGARVYNTLALLPPADPAGAAAEGSGTIVYDKHHIVPFGEYIPLGDLFERFGIHGLAAQQGYGYSRGPGAALLDLPDGLGTALPLICYEAIFPRDLRAAPGRADWVLQITNDAWFGTFSGPQQHLVQARFRAIEFGLPLARAANTGVSAVIDARGRVTAALGLGVEGHLDVELPGALPPTPYARLGDVPLAAFIAVALSALLYRRRTKPIDRSGTPG